MCVVYIYNTQVCSVHTQHTCLLCIHTTHMRLSIILQGDIASRSAFRSCSLHRCGMPIAANRVVCQALPARVAGLWQAGWSFIFLRDGINHLAHMYVRTYVCTYVRTYERTYIRT